MQNSLKRKLAIGTTALAAAAFAGGAYAATQDPSTNPRQVYLNDVAKRLGVTPSQLNSALQGAFLDQLQAAVAAGKLTQAQANAIKQRMQQGGAPLGGERGLGPFGGGRFFPGPGLRPGAGPLEGAAAYLGLTETQLRGELGSGKSLAQIAAARGKSVAGLKDAITAATRTRLDKLVAGKTITRAQEQQILSNLSTRLDNEINRTGWAPRSGWHPMFGSRASGIMVPPLAVPSLPGLPGQAGGPPPPAPSGPIY